MSTDKWLHLMAMWPTPGPCTSRRCASISRASRPNTFPPTAGPVCQQLTEEQGAVRLGLSAADARPLAGRFRKDRDQRRSAAAHSQRERGPAVRALSGDDSLDCKPVTRVSVAPPRCHEPVRERYSTAATMFVLLDHDTCFAHHKLQVTLPAPWRFRRARDTEVAGRQSGRFCFTPGTAASSSVTISGMIAERRTFGLAATGLAIGLLLAATFAAAQRVALGCCCVCASFGGSENGSLQPEGQVR